MRSGLCTSSDLGSFISSLPSGITLDQTSIFTSGIRFDESSFPSEPIDTEEDAEEPTYEEITSVDEAIAPGQGMTATRSADEPLETNETEVVDDSWQKNSENGVENDTAAEEAAEELYEEIMSGENDGLRRRSHHVRRQTKLPSLRLGHAAGRRKRQFEDGDSYVDDDAEEEYGSTTDDTYGEAVDTANKDYGFDDSLSGLEGEDYGSDTSNEDNEPSTTSSDIPLPTKATHKTHKPALSNGISDSSSAVPIYTAPIVYHVSKTGYYCIGE